MFSSTVTVFNYYDDGTGAVWYPHVISNVHLETDRGLIMKKYGPDSKDKAVLHVSFEIDDGQKIVTDLDDRKLKWIPPKAWKKQDIADLKKTITFNPDMDFIWMGAWDGDNPVVDKTYSDRRTGGFYGYMNANEDDVYKITNVSGPYTVIPHFEIGGA